MKKDNKVLIDTLKPGTKFIGPQGNKCVLLDSKNERPGKECWIVDTTTWILYFFGFVGNDSDWRKVKVVK